MATITATVLVGCQGKIASEIDETSSGDGSQSAGSKMAELNASVASDDAPTQRLRDRKQLPSMRSYTLEHAQSARYRAAIAEPVREAKSLSPGQYCFHKNERESWLSIRFLLNENQQVQGESAGTITHPQKGETRYTQTFAGELRGNQAVVKVMTDVAQLTQSRQETWIVNTVYLDMGRVSINEVPCADVATDFQDT
ncbi:MAG: hypothetical protein WA885_14220 [Phormidesmis sp.]